MLRVQVRPERLPDCLFQQRAPTPRNLRQNEPIFRSECFQLPRAPFLGSKYLAANRDLSI